MNPAEKKNIHGFNLPILSQVLSAWKEEPEIDERDFLPSVVITDELNFSCACVLKIKKLRAHLKISHTKIKKNHQKDV